MHSNFKLAVAAEAVCHQSQCLHDQLMARDSPPKLHPSRLLPRTTPGTQTHGHIPCQHKLRKNLKGCMKKYPLSFLLSGIMCLCSTASLWVSTQLSPPPPFSLSLSRSLSMQISHTPMCTQPRMTVKNHFKPLFK